MKTIVAIKNTSQKGKSSSARAFAAILQATYPNHKVLHPNFTGSNRRYDISLILRIRYKTIAIESQGDPGTKMKKRLHKIISKFNPDIIVCTCRTSGETANAVYYQKTYQKIWTSSYQCEDTTLQTALNDLKGQHILDLLQQLNLI